MKIKSEEFAIYNGLCQTKHFVQREALNVKLFEFTNTMYVNTQMWEMYFDYVYVTAHTILEATICDGKNHRKMLISFSFWHF